MGQITLCPGRIVASRWPDQDETVWPVGGQGLVPYLTWSVNLEWDFTLGDLLQLVDQEDVTALAQILDERLTPVLEEAREGSSEVDDRDPLHFLRVYNQHENGDLHRGLDAWGTWDKPCVDVEEPAGPTNTWVSVSLTPVGRLLHLPIRYDPELVFRVALHFIVPLLVALACYRRRWQSAVLIMISTMIIDADHLLADPIYDPERCSIGFHPMHTAPAIVVYATLFALPSFWRREVKAWPATRPTRTMHLVGLGLLIHMGVDWTDCLW